MTQKVIYNNISDRLRSEIGSIPKKGKYTFELTSTRFDRSDSDPKYHRMVGIGPKTIPSKCTIYDPYKEDYVELAYIDRYELDGTPVLGEITFETDNIGQITCFDGRVKDMRLFEYLKLSSWNASNPHRDQTSKPLYKEINLSKEKEQEYDILEVKDLAVSKFLTMDISDVKAYLKRLNLSTVGTDKEVKLRLRGYVVKAPKDFIDSLENKEDKTLSIIALAEELDVIHNDHSKGAWKWSNTGQVIHTYSRRFMPGDTKHKKLLDFIKEDSNGKLVLEEIETQIKSAQKKQQLVVG